MAWLLCKLFGHQPPIYSEKGWFSPGQEYAVRVSSPVTDGCGRLHALVYSECPRCGVVFLLCRIHVPRMDKQKERSSDA